MPAAVVTLSDDDRVAASPMKSSKPTAAKNKAKPTAAKKKAMPKASPKKKMMGRKMAKAALMERMTLSLTLTCGKPATAGMASLSCRRRKAMARSR